MGIKKGQFSWLFLALVLLVGCGSTTDRNLSPSLLPSSQPIGEEGSISSSSGDATPPQASLTGILEVHFIDVGQGDANLLDLGEEEVLIDGGNPGTGVLQYLKGLGIGELELVIATHPHADHIGGLAEIFSALRVLEVWDSGVSSTSATYAGYINTITQRAILLRTARTGDRREFQDGATLTVLSPDSGNPGDVNNSSVVTRLVFGRISFLFMGDAGSAVEKTLLSRYDLNSDVLKVAHHGSSYGSTDPFVRAVSPAVSVISVGANSYGHPTALVINRLFGLGSSVYRTDLGGTVILRTDGSGLEVIRGERSIGTTPSPSTPSSGSGTTGEATGVEALVDINHGSLSELDRIVGVGPVIGERIIAGRPYGSVDDLLRVSGIGAVTLAKIKEQGLACVR